MKRKLTLCIIYKPFGADDAGFPQVLLGYKKRGFGAGRWNGFGGKVDEGETIEQAAHRELAEEAGIYALDLHQLGTIDFVFQEDERPVDTVKPVSNELEVHVFRATDISGVPAESDEMRPHWFYIDEIPFAEMWPDDRYWFPFFLRGTPFYGRFDFDGNDRLLKTHMAPL